MKVIIFGQDDKVIHRLYKNIIAYAEFIHITDDTDALMALSNEHYYDLLIIDTIFNNANVKKTVLDLKKNRPHSLIIFHFIRNDDLPQLKKILKFTHHGLLFEYHTPKILKNEMFLISSISSQVQKNMLTDLFIEIMKQRNIETSTHIKNVAFYTKKLAQAIAFRTKEYPFLTSSFIEDLYFAAHFHDIGKIGIPDEVLLKPGRYNEQEFNVMKQHTIYGEQILKKLSLSYYKNRYIIMANIICKHHHEKWDGSGYPVGLSGKNIPFIARIVAVADVYDALVSERSYKKSMSHEEAVSVIKNSSGSHFQPMIVQAFLEIEHVFQAYNYEGNK
jgi:HD-GYP domain-containing protein (c-di-GMP phosphodiesterase class II)